MVAINVVEKIRSFLFGGFNKTIDSIGNAIDKNITNDEERQQLKNELAKIISEWQTLLLQSFINEQLSDKKGNWFQRSWRPILLLTFGFILVVNYALFPMFGKNAVQFPPEYWTFLDIIVPTAVIARTVDKMKTTFDSLTPKNKHDKNVNG
jgi:hypothetical protein